MSERAPVQIRVKPKRRWRRKPRGASAVGRNALSCLSPPGGATGDAALAVDHFQPRPSINTRRRRSIATPPSTKRARLAIIGAGTADAPPPASIDRGGGNGSQVSTAAGTDRNDQVAGPSNQKTPENEELTNGAKQIVRIGGKKRRRRAPRRKWKPYFKMTNDEKRLQEIREEKRAEQVRAQRFKKGLPVAPYNTTQFLFDDLKQRAGNDQPSNVDEIIENIRRHHRSESYDESGSDGSAAVGSSGGEANGAGGSGGSAGAFELFNDKEFDNEYDSAFVERLSAMTKQELIREYLDLEKQFERTRTDLIVRDRDLADCQQRLARAELLLAESRQDAEAAPVVHQEENFDNASSDIMVSDPMDPGVSSTSNVVT